MSQPAPPASAQEAQPQSHESDAPVRIVSDIPEPPPVMHPSHADYAKAHSVLSSSSPVNGSHPGPKAPTQVSALGPTPSSQQLPPLVRNLAHGKQDSPDHPKPANIRWQPPSVPGRQVSPTQNGSANFRWQEPQKVQYSGQQYKQLPPPSLPPSAVPTASPQGQAQHPALNQQRKNSVQMHPAMMHPANQQAQPPSMSQPHGHGVEISGRPIIMDPPSRNKPSPASNVGFASPQRDYARENAKFVDDCTRINFAVQQSIPEACRRIVRDNWEKCLLGSEFHQAFVLNAAIHHSSPSITRRAVTDFGAKMVQDCKEELIRHYAAADLDAVSDYLVGIASDAFLDKCLEKRLLTIEAKPLINALARAERLGYEQQDVVGLQDQPEQGPSPHGPFPQNVQLPGAGPTPPGPASFPPANGFPPGSMPGQQPGQAQSPMPTPMPMLMQPANSPQAPGNNSRGRGREPMQCLRCFRTFVYMAAYQHHMEKNVCSRLPPSSGGYRWACEHCGSPFATANGLQYHLNDKVCLPSSQPAAVNGYGSGPAQHGIPPSTPEPGSRVGQTGLSRQSTGVSPNPGDPYAHLTPERLNDMNMELRDAEQKFAIRFKEAEMIPDPEDRRQKLEGLKNSFGTKQSMIRKKYGVRLRERRTRAEIAAEKIRMGLKPDEPPTPSKPASVPTQTPTQTAPAPASNGWTAANVAPPHNTSGPVPQLPPPSHENDNKRRRMDENGGSVPSSHTPVAPEYVHKPVSAPASVPKISTTEIAGAGPPATVPDSVAPAASIVPVDVPSETASVGSPVADDGTRPLDGPLGAGTNDDSALVRVKMEADLSSSGNEDEPDSEMDDIPARAPPTMPPLPSTNLGRPPSK